MYNMLYLPNTSVPLHTTVLLALTVGLVGCSSSRETSQPPASEASTALTHTVRDTNRGTRYFIRGLTETHRESYEEAIIYYHQALEHVSDSGAVFSGLARAHHQNKHLGQAAEYARKAVAVDPDRPAYYYQLAEIQHEAQDISDAITTYRRLTRRFPEETKAYYALGKLQLANDSVEAAAETFRHLLDRPGANVRARYQLLRIYRRQNDYPGMVRTLEALIEEDASNPDLYFMLVDVYRKQGKTRTAIRVLEDLRDREPGNAEAAFRLVELYRQIGAGDRADSLLEQTLERDDLSAEVLFDQARSLYFRPRSNRRTDRTVRHLLERVLEVDPNHSQALYMLGTLYLQQGAYEDALERLERAVDQNPRNQEAWVRLLAASIRAGKHERALELADEALILFPRQFSLLRLAGTASLQSGRDQKAADYLNRALEAARGSEVDDEMRSNVASMLGMVYSRLDQTARSDSLYRKAITWNEDNATALNNYAYSLAERGIQLEEALELARRAVDLSPDTASFLDTLGWVYFRMNRLDEAAHWIKKAIDTGHASATVHEHYGDIQHALGNDAEALEYWNRAINMNPELESSVGKKIERLNSSQ